MAGAALRGAAQARERKGIGKKGRARSLLARPFNFHSTQSILDASSQPARSDRESVPTLARPPASPAHVRRPLTSIRLSPCLATVPTSCSPFSARLQYILTGDKVHSTGSLVTRVTRRWPLSRSLAVSPCSHWVNRLLRSLSWLCLFFADTGLLPILCSNTILSVAIQTQNVDGYGRASDSDSNTPHHDYSMSYSVVL